MVTIPWSDILNRAVTDPLTDAARNAREVMCQIRQAGDEIFYGTGPAALQSLNDLVTARGLFDRICFDFPVTPSATEYVPFPGGQCPVLYVVEGRLTNSANDNVVTGSNVFLGPLQRVRVVTTPNAGIVGRTRYSFEVVNANGVATVNDLGLLDAPVVGNVTIRIRRQDNQPDNCGDRPPQVILPPTPPPTIYNIPVRIGPFIITRPVELPDLVVNNWPDFTFAPNVIIEGVQFNFTNEGITFDFGPNVPLPPGEGGSVDLNPVLNRIAEAELSINTGVSEAESTINDNINDVESDIAALASLIRCCCCEENVTYTVEDVVENTFGGTFPLPPNTVAVRIIGSDFNLDRIRTQDGSGTAPTVFYWGWYAIGYSGGFQGDRVNLHYQNQAIGTLEFASSITVNPIYDARATIVAIVKNKNCISEE